jgi:hypothetical protein
MKNVTEKKVVEKIKTHILCPVPFLFPEGVPFMGYVEKYSRAGQSQVTVHYGAEKKKSYLRVG